MKYKISLIVVLSFFLGQSQTATSITNIQTPNLDETSGLLFYNNKLFTFNDSGGQAEIYEINSSNGSIVRTITINNATNVDWEDITQDATHIYIGDIGNNNGNRTDLKIYKISKSDFDDADNIATAETISYSYANQTTFNSLPNNNNWDAEGLISFGDKLLIFTKNWVNNMVNVYSIPKISGSYSAQFVSTYNTNGLITGADISFNEDVIYLTGYSSSQAPFMYTIHNISASNLDIFSGNVSPKITNIVPLGNQVEAISLFEITPTKHRLYISNEKYTFTSGPISITFPAKLWFIELNADTFLSLEDIANNHFVLYPNPCETAINSSVIIDEVTIYDNFGKIIFQNKNVNSISLENLVAGVYFAQIKLENQFYFKKIIKK
ncbi:T9SS type A sorting domain-containing protein [Flavobacterium cyclinae]|uniref:T9SS type A sorting domain-containing protein n=1 Tax=Flavobacterium cyclinae TaxID=2895947 RepID=UPI001E38E567|nr:T9SS type A sorting domain-containing protein [Flavobacterium cyclinae]UGS21901.1 T9SS type A sorting domain-containing protein [Flavobacterium cyclinae]